MSAQPRKRPSQQSLLAGRGAGRPSDDNAQQQDGQQTAARSQPSPRSQRRPSLSGGRRRTSSRYSTSSITSFGLSADDDDDDTESTAAPAQTIRDVSQAFRSGRPSPYHMAVVTLIGSLASGMPLASMFKVYTFIMCEVYDPRIRDKGGVGDAVVNGSATTGWTERVRAVMVAVFGAASAAGRTASDPATLVKLPPAPELPNPPECSLPWVQKSTSSYSAAMVTVGALLGLMTLSRASGLSRRFGRKPLLLLTHLFLALALLVFRVAVLLPPYAAAVVLYCAVVLSEASAGAPLRIALQNYVVDTTSESQRAGALSFIEGFGQIGAFPSSALGGLLASLSGEFFAPFYANVALMIVAFLYILLLVPESKRKHEHTLIDSWTNNDDVESARSQEGAEEGADGSGADDSSRQRQQSSSSSSSSSNRQADNGNASGDGGGDGGQRTSGFSESARTWSTSHSATDDSRFKWRSKLRALNFLRPLAIFKPTVRHYSDITTHDALAAPPAPENGNDAAPSPAVKRIQKRTDLRLLNLALVVVFEETYQCFLVPLLLLYNGQKFGFDVLQNGYLVSVLQSVRALFLTAIFPPAVALARRYVARRGLRKRKEKLRKMKAEAKQKRRQARADAKRSATAGGDERAGEESRPLLPSRRTEPRRGEASKAQYGTMTSRDYALSETQPEGAVNDNGAVRQGPSSSSPTAGVGASDEPRAGRRRPSYHAAASLGLSKLRRSASQTRRLSTYSSRAIIESNWETHSIFTSAPSELIKKIQRGKLDITIMLASYALACCAFLLLASSTYAASSTPHPPSMVDGAAASKPFWASPWIPLTLGVVALQLASGSTSLRTALVVNAVAEDDQTKALAAHQILCTSVNAFMPLATSAVYGVALERGRPELVWVFKAVFAALSAVGALGLFWSHRGFYEKAHDEEEEEEEGEGESSDSEDADPATEARRRGGGGEEAGAAS